MYYSVYVLLFSRVIFTFVIYFSCLILYYYCRIVLMISAALFTLYVFVPPKWIHRFDFAGKKILWKIHCKWTVWALKMLANEFHQRKKIIFGTSKKLARGKDMNFKWKESMVNNVPWWLPKLWVLVNNERTSAQDDYRCWVGSAWISIIFTNKKKISMTVRRGKMLWTRIDHYNVIAARQFFENCVSWNVDEHL